MQDSDYNDFGDDYSGSGPTYSGYGGSQQFETVEDSDDSSGSAASEDRKE